MKNVVLSCMSSFHYSISTTMKADELLSITISCLYSSIAYKANFILLRDAHCERVKQPSWTSFLQWVYPQPFYYYWVSILGFFSRVQYEKMGKTIFDKKNWCVLYLCECRSRHWYNILHCVQANEWPRCREVNGLGDSVFHNPCVLLRSLGVNEVVFSIIIC